MEPSTSISRAITLARTSPFGAMVRRCSLISMDPSTWPSMIRSSRLWICPLNTTLFPRTAFAAGGGTTNGAADIALLVYLANLNDGFRLGSDRRHGRASLEHGRLSNSGSHLMLQAI